MQYCADPKAKDAETQDVGVLVVESRFDEKSIYLYVVCPEWALGSGNGRKDAHEARVRRETAA